MDRTRAPVFDVVWLVLIVGFIAGWATVYLGASGIGSLVVYVTTIGLVLVGVAALARFFIRIARH